MALYDVRCKDVARLLSSSPRTPDEIGDMIHSLYPRIDARGSWVKDVLTRWNPLVAEEGNRFALSRLGRAFISLPGREGDRITDEEKVFLIGVVMLDDSQRRVASELIALGSSPYPDGWVVDQTRAVLRELSLL